MEMTQLNEWQEDIIYRILVERLEEITLPGLRENIVEYRKTIADHAGQLRRSGQLTHKGQPVKTKPEFKRICVEKGWRELLHDAEGLDNA